MQWSNRRRPRCGADREGSEAGNAIVESLGVIAVLILPAFALVVSFASMLGAEHAAAAAARDGARAFVRAESAEAARARMEEAVSMRLADRGAKAENAPRVACSASPCLSPGEKVSVTVAVRARLEAFQRDVVVTRTATMPVDDFRRTRP